MDWFDIDHNGIVDGRDFFILNEIFVIDEEDKQEEDLISDDTTTPRHSYQIVGCNRKCTGCALLCVLQQS